MAPDAHGLTLLPLLSGERGPGWSDRAGATIDGPHPRDHAGRPAARGLEAVALQFAPVIDADLPGEQTVVAHRRRARQLAAWTQIMADALGRPSPSARRRGLEPRRRLLALEALGEQPGEAPLGETFEPDPAATEAYRAALERQQALYERVSHRRPAPRPPAGPASGR